MNSYHRDAAEIPLAKINMPTMLCAVLVSSLGLVVLAGWIFNVETLKSVLPGLVTMKANTAIGFILSGLSMALLASGRETRVRNGASLVTAGILFLLGAATMSEYVFGINLGIDQLFFREQPGAAGTLDLGRMAPSTAFCFTVTGILLSLLNLNKAVAVSQVLAYLVGFLGLANLLGYTYGIKALYEIGRYTQMAVHTAAAFILLGFGILMVRRDRLIAKIVSGDGMGSMSARRLLPLALILPIVIAYFRIKGEHLGLFSSDLGVGLVALSYILFFSAAIMWIAAVINRTDKGRSDSLYELRKISEKLQISTDEWKRTFDSISDMIFIIDTDNNIVRANKAFLDAIKKTTDEVVGKKCYEMLHRSDKPWPSCPLEKTKTDHNPHTEEVDDPVIGIPLLVTTSPIFDDAGIFSGAVHIAKDIRARKEIEGRLRKQIEELEKFKRVTVDRELRMKELKSRIKELENKPGKEG